MYDIFIVFQHLEKFFRNLLLGETNELKNRYLVISAPEEFTPQAEPDKLTGQVPDKFLTDNPPNTSVGKSSGE